ncbi:putative carotenoid cleavage dioxygenase 4 [Citrus sinensis]|nr:putative carotenoid cleavage dioxygenase 4 [Citrus sinensis]
MDAFSSSTLSTLPSHIPLLSQTKKPPLSLPSSSLSQRKTSLSSSSQRKTSSSSSSARTMIVNTINNLFNNLMMINSNYKLQPSLDPKRALSNNFAPVDELPPTQCQSLIISSMVMACCTALESHKAKPPSVAAVSKLTKYTIENTVGQPSINNGFGLTNASLSFLGDHLFAICEGDLPYAVRLTSNGDTETLGRHDFDEKSGMNMTAHPKKDPATDETFAFRYGRHPLFMHDFAITKKHTVSVDTQLNMYYTEMILRGDSLLHSDRTKESRIGVIPRCAKDSLQMRWFDVPGFNNIHAINEWDEEDGNNTRSGGVAANTEADEDNGYVVSYVHDAKTGESKFLVTDAKSPHLDIEAVVKSTQSVPTGSHGLFVREIELRKLYKCKYPIT